MSILVTGAAGFIGFHVCKRLLAEGHQVIGVDNLNDYYDVSLKRARLRLLEKSSQFAFYKLDLANQDHLQDLFRNHSIKFVIHLAAQAGVRYSIDHPHSYVSSNINGFLNILESCRHFPVKHLIYASSSSVYGANTKIPFSTLDSTDHPLSMYAATKKANELMAHTYSHLFNIPATGLRFFTVYGPWGRPDMAYYSFTKAIMEGTTLQIYNNGDMSRDFTYIDDIVEEILRLLDSPPKPDGNWNSFDPNPDSSFAPYKIYNIGNHHPVKLIDFIRILENLLEKKANIVYLPMQPGDVKETYSDITSLQEATGYSPATTIEAGLATFVDWYKQYHQ